MLLQNRLDAGEAPAVLNGKPKPPINGEGTPSGCTRQKRLKSSHTPNPADCISLDQKNVTTSPQRFPNTSSGPAGAVDLLSTQMRIALPRKLYGSVDLKLWYGLLLDFIAVVEEDVFGNQTEACRSFRIFSSCELRKQAYLVSLSLSL